MPEVIAHAGEDRRGRGRASGRRPSRRRGRRAAQIVVRLLVERQTLLRRLKIAEMAAQVQQLIELQTKVLAATEALPEQPDRPPPGPEPHGHRRPARREGDLRPVQGGAGRGEPLDRPVGRRGRRRGCRLLGEHATGRASRQRPNRTWPGRRLRRRRRPARRPSSAACRPSWPRCAAPRSSPRRDANALSRKIRDLIEKQEETRKATEQSKLEKPEEVEKLVGRRRPSPQGDRRSERRRPRAARGRRPAGAGARRRPKRPPPSCSSRNSPRPWPSRRTCSRPWRRPPSRPKQNQAEAAQHSPDELEKLHCRPGGRGQGPGKGRRRSRPRPRKPRKRSRPRPRPRRSKWPRSWKRSPRAAICPTPFSKQRRGRASTPRSTPPAK